MTQREIYEDAKKAIESVIRTPVEYKGPRLTGMEGDLIKKIFRKVNYNP